jgi:hypothetical protein
MTSQEPQYTHTKYTRHTQGTLEHGTQTTQDNRTKRIGKLKQKNAGRAGMHPQEQEPSWLHQYLGGFAPVQ